MTPINLQRAVAITNLVVTDLLRNNFIGAFQNLPDEVNKDTGRDKGALIQSSPWSHRRFYIGPLVAHSQG